jgi:catechol 2,3-dioxygenase-like lactoylglutathione lyase family enzyme
VVSLETSSPKPETSGKGSPLGIAILGVEDLAASLAFYRDIIGLDATEAVTWRGPAFETHWRLPRGAKAGAVLLSSGESDVGRILLLQFDAAERRTLHQP